MYRIVYLMGSASSTFLTVDITRDECSIRYDQVCLIEVLFVCTCSTVPSCLYIKVNHTTNPNKPIKPSSPKPPSQKPPHHTSPKYSTQPAPSYLPS